MKFWYFRFEGRYIKGSVNFGDGVFSGCLVAETNFRRAKSQFLEALKDEEIAIDEILEYFSLDGTSLDSSDPKNDFWISWYYKTENCKEPCFDVFHVYKLDRSAGSLPQ